MNEVSKIDYMKPDVPSELPWFEIPVVKATPESLQGYGMMVNDYNYFPIEILPWPAPGWRQLDPGTGNEAGTVSGIFEFWWEGDYFFGKNNAVNERYLLGWSKNPCDAKKDAPNHHSKVLLWHANYHPDGGQLFFPLDNTPFIVPLALPGDDVSPEEFTAFYFDGTKGLYIHPNVWHEGIFPLAPRARFYDEQGKIHARISCNIAEEFGVFLEMPLTEPED